VASTPIYHGNFTGSQTAAPVAFTGAANANGVAGGIAAVLLGLAGFSWNMM
jgi:hypothetical protein